MITESLRKNQLKLIRCKTCNNYDLMVKKGKLKKSCTYCVADNFQVVNLKATIE